MAFITGIQIIHAPGGALNNQGGDPTSSNQNEVAVKRVRVAGSSGYPYVSSQAYRYWLRSTLEKQEGWETSPIFREKKVAYSDANPIKYSDDDLFGYMRVPGKKVEAADSRASMVGATDTKETVTRVSPFKVGTIIAMAPGHTSDFGTMSRHEGNPVPFEHQFYYTSLKGMFALDLSSSGVFSYEQRTGFLNLDDIRKKLAEEAQLEHDAQTKSFKLNINERVKRVGQLLEAMPLVEGGAKAALHYTDVSPAVTIFAAVRGGNNPFQYLITGDREGNAKIVPSAFKEVADVWGDILLSPIYIGWKSGYAEQNRQEMEKFFKDNSSLFSKVVEIGHPKAMFKKAADSLKDNPEWFN